MRYYILDERRRVVLTDMLGWARYFEHADRRVDHTVITDDCYVSTVFLGMDHNFTEEGDPILFETMVFGPEKISINLSWLKVKDKPIELDGHTQRYSTYGEAHKGHWEIVDNVKVVLGLRKE